MTPIHDAILRPALAAGERLLNRCIDESTRACDLVGKLQGKRFAVHVEGLDVSIVLLADRGRIALGSSTASATATLRAPPLDLVRLLSTGSLRELQSTKAELTGDLQVAEDFAALLRHARPDLEEELARWIGDLGAHEIGRIGARAERFWSRAVSALRMNVGEYLQEESRALPTLVEVQHFFDEVERLRDDVERAAERLDRAAVRIAAIARDRRSTSES